jgi:hypothetical protein
VRLLLSLSLIALATAFVQPDAAHAQAVAAASTGPAPSRIDIYGGYGYFYPFTSDIGGINYQSIPLGAVGNVAGYFSKHFGIQAEGNYSPNGPTDNNCAYTAQAGPIIRMQHGRLVPFFHALGGGAITGGPRAQGCNVWGWGATGGFGLDVIIPGFHDHLALRPIQADFMYSQINNGPLAGGGFSGGFGQIYAIRASAGLTLRFGDIAKSEKPAMDFTCRADPADPFPGDPVTLTASTVVISPKRKPIYLWTSTGGKVAGDGAVAAVDTASLQPGTYDVAAKLVEGDKKRLVASCTTTFTVRAYEPPTIMCTADKAAINSGDPVAIGATARSPQNRPLLYTYTTTGGLISGNGPAATLTTAGVSPGNITVTCSVADDKGQSASATTSVVVATPAPPPTPVLPQLQPLCGITFDRDKKRPDRVDNEAKGCLDDVALTMQRETADKLLIVGSHAGKETNRDAAERAMNAAEYLTKEKGIDPNRLDLRISPDDSRSVAMMLVPPGAVIDAGTATSFDTSSVKRTGQPYGTGTTTAKKVVRRKRKPVATTPPQ